MPDISISMLAYTWAPYPDRANIAVQATSSPWHWLRGPRVVAGTLRVEAALTEMRVQLLCGRSMTVIDEAISTGGAWEMRYRWPAAPYPLLVIATPLDASVRAQVFNI